VLFESQGEAAELEKEEKFRLDELNENNKEIERQEIKLERLNREIDDLQGEERHVQDQLRGQTDEIDNLKHDRLLVQEAIKHQAAANLLMHKDIEAEKAVILKFESQLDE
jgi:aspartate oxidase